MAFRGKTIFTLSMIFVGIIILFSVVSFLGNLLKQNLMALAVIPTLGLLIWAVILIVNEIKISGETKAREVERAERKESKKEHKKKSKDEANYYHRLRMLGKHLEKNPNDFKTQFEIATIYHFQAKNMALAKKAYDKLMKMNPSENIKNQVESRLKQYNFGLSEDEDVMEDEGPVRYEVSEEELEGSLYYNPEAAEKREREKEELRLDASMMNPQTPKEYIEVAQTLFGHAKVNMLQRAVKLDYEYPDSHIALGNAYMEVGEPEKAIRSFQNVIDMDENNEMAYFLMGKAYEELEYFDDAIFCYKKLLKSNPHNTSALIRLATTYYKKGNLDEGEKICRVITQKDPESYHGFYTLGLILDEKNMLDQALVAYNKAVKIKPDSTDTAEIYNKMGKVFHRKNNLEAAIKAFQNAIKVNEEYCFSYYNTAELFEDVGKKEEAITFYKKFIEYGQYDYPDLVEEVEERLEAGLPERPEEKVEEKPVGAVVDKKDLSAKDLFLKARKAEGAQKIVLLKKAVAADTDFVAPLYELGNCYREFGNLPKAIETYKEIINKFPDFAMGYNSLGEIFMNYDQKDKAKFLFTKALQLNPNLTTAKENLEKFSDEKTE